MFLSILGPVEYSLLKSLVESSKVRSLTYQELLRSCLNISSPRFYQHNQSPGETISDEFLALKHLASSCEFGTILGEALRGRFVCGLAGEVYHRRLLSEKDLTFKKACNVALTLELAHKDSKELGAHPSILIHQ